MCPVPQKKIVFAFTFTNEQGVDHSHAICVGRRRSRIWSNGHDPSQTCSQAISSSVSWKTLEFGMSIYNLNGAPIQVFDLVARINDKEFKHFVNKNNYTVTYHDYK